jgi:NTE family protein
MRTSRYGGVDSAVTRPSNNQEAQVPQNGRRVALALGGGGARGYAHIGVIRELERRGLRITGIAGTSMGALVGGLYAAGALDAYTDWVQSLSQRDVIRLLDPTITGPGMVRAEKVLDKVTELVGDRSIEDLTMPFTAVATDLIARKEVWFQRGRLDTAIRASIAIPGVISPVVVGGRLLADGGLMNPVPVVPTAAIVADLTVAVSLSDESGVDPVPLTSFEPLGSAESRTGSKQESELARSIRGWLESIRGQEAEEDSSNEPAPPDRPFERPPAGLRTRDVLDLSLDAMRTVMGRYRLAGYPPDVLISIPRKSAGTMEFHRASELIAIGEERTGATLDEFERAT